MLGLLESPSDWAIIVIVVVVLFGGAQLPKLARNLGQAQKEFKKGLAEGQKGKDKADAAKTESAESASTSEDK
jgi:sec-independent protein translocase protein TatA